MSKSEWGKLRVLRPEHIDRHGVEIQAERNGPGLCYVVYRVNSLHVDVTVYNASPYGNDYIPSDKMMRRDIDTLLKLFTDRVNVDSSGNAMPYAYHEFKREGIRRDRHKGKYVTTGIAIARYTYPIRFKTNPQKQCAFFKSLDEKYHTTKNSPLHHDSRCPIHYVSR